MESELESDIRIHPPDDVMHPLSNAYIVTQFNIYLKKIRNENDIYRFLNHEYVHGVLQFIGGLGLSYTYDKIHGYVDWVHCFEDLDGKTTWDIIEKFELDCPRCRTLNKKTVWDSDEHRCKKCGFVYNEKIREDWLELYSNESFQRVLSEGPKPSEKEIKETLKRMIEEETDPTIREVFQFALSTKPREGGE